MRVRPVTTTTRAQRPLAWQRDPRGRARHLLRQLGDLVPVTHPDITALIDDAGMRYSTIAPYLKNLRHGV